METAAFNRQAARFEDLAAELKRAEPSAGAGEYRAEAAPDKVAAAVQAALETPSARRGQVMETSTAEIAASTPAEEADRYKGIRQIAGKQPGKGCRCSRS